MADESFIQLPADSSGKRVRAFPLDVQQADGTYLTVYEQVLILSDPDGNLVYVKGGEISTYDDKVATLLGQVIEGQAALCKLLMAAIRPGAETLDDVNDFIQLVEG